MKKWIAGGIVIIVGVTAAVFTTITEQGDLRTALYIVDTGGKSDLTAGEALMVVSDLTRNWSATEKGEATPVASNVRMTIRTFDITEAESNSVNAKCKCLKVDDLENPTTLVSY